MQGRCFSLVRTVDHLCVKFRAGPPLRWVEGVSAISEGDAAGRLRGTELFLYEEPDIDLAKIREQFRGCGDVEEYDGLLYLTYRPGQAAEPGGGFGRGASVALDAAGRLSVIKIPWIESGAATPVVDAAVALAKLEYTAGDPAW